MAWSAPRGIALALVAAAVPGFARAQNVVMNGEFTTNVIGWTVTGPGSFQWDPLDWQSSATSGSGLLRNTAFPMDTFAFASQCVPFSPAGPVEFGAHIRVPSNQPNAGSTYVTLRFYDNASCASSPTGGDIVTYPPGAPWNTWVPVFKTNVVPPAGTQSAQVLLNVLKELMGTSFSAHFDHVVLGPAGATPVELQALSVE